MNFDFFSSGLDANAVSVIFAAALLLGVALKLWLHTRQIRHVLMHRGTVPPAFAAQVGLEAHRRAADYTVAKSRLAMVSEIVGAVVVLAWTLLGGLQWLNQALVQWVLPGYGPMAYQIALVVGFSIISGIVDLPLGLWNTFVLEERFGFNRLTWRLWLIDALKAAVLNVVIGLPLLATVLWLMGHAGPQWWLWTWLAWMAFAMLMMVIYPMFIAPLFNRFEPLQDEALAARVQSLLQRCGFKAKGLMVMDGSRRSAHANAYFTGLGASKRVVFYDTLLKQLSPDEVEAVLAHELGHFKLRHIPKRMAVLFGTSLAALALLGWLSNQTGFYEGMGVQVNLGAPWPALALILFMLALPWLTLWFGPLSSLSSRRHEFEADAYAASHTNAAALQSALVKLQEDNAATLTPDPMYVKFHYSHPPLSERLPALQALGAKGSNDGRAHHD